MIMALPIAFTLFAMALFQALVLSAWRDRFRKEVRAHREGSDADPESTVTIVVPARDARDTLAPLLQDLHAQDLPKEVVEVLVVDDHSSDGTAGIVQAMMRTWPQLRLLQNDGQGKKAAITTAVRKASHGILLLTDADVRCGSQRIRAILDAMEGLDLLILPVRTEGAGLLGRVQEEEQVGLLGMAFGEALLGRPGLAYGANLAFRREAFDAVGGYAGDRYASGDDVFLVQRMKKAGRSIGSLLDPRAVVTVHAEPTWGGFFSQRVRWAGKMRGIRGATPWIGLFALLWPWILIGATVNYEFALVVEEDGLETLLLLAAAWLLWLVPVVALVNEVRRFLGQRARPLVSLCCYLFFMIYSPVIAVVALFHRPVWKGRRMHR